MNEPTIKDSLIVALDFSSASEARKVIDELRGLVRYLKVGKQMFTAEGPRLVRELVDEGFEIFLDLKFHDIPNTVASAAIEATKLGVSMFNVHASGGAEMMRETARAVSDLADKTGRKPIMLGVTVLTSLNDDDLSQMGVSRSVGEQVAVLSRLAKEAGLDGVVASANEIEIIRRTCGEEFVIVTPGIRPLWAAKNDQKRIVTPKAALEMGADYIVVGRPITMANDKIKAVEKLFSDKYE